MLDANSSALLVPSPNGTYTKVDLSQVYAAEGRIHEVATVNPHRAPELLATFNLAYAKLGEIEVGLIQAYNAADNAARRVRSIVLLDRVPQVLKDKGLSSARSPGGSEDQRNAILDMDEEYTAARERVEMIEAMRTLVANKKKSLEWAYTSVKKVLGGDPTSLGQNRSFSAGADMGPSVEPGVVVQSRQVPGFGGAKR